ncbi:MAG: 3'-5' exonuclease [Planctomycetota bacterium]|jgi:DNA polymerase-3 subunit epsilon
MILDLRRPLVFLDLETTGLDPETDRIVEIGLVKLHPDGRREPLCERVNPERDIPDNASRVHGIRTEDVCGLFGKPRLKDRIDDLLVFVGDCDLAGFNSIAFDTPLWIQECARCGSPFSMAGRHQIDARNIFRIKETTWDRFLMGKRTLAAAVRHFCGKDLPGAHAADVDAGATIDVLLAQLERYPDLPRDVPGLHDFCVEAGRQLAG